MAAHSSTLAWKIPWMEEPGGLQSVESLESDTTERFHFHFSLSCTGEGNGNPLQCSCLENPRDRGAWWATVCGVAQSRTRLKWLSSSSSSHKWVLNFVKGFFCIYWDNHMVFIFPFLICSITLISLHILKNPCIPGMNPTWSWCMCFLMCCWILFAKILWGFLHLCSSVILAYSFLFCVLSLPDFGIRMIVAS